MSDPSIDILTQRLAAADIDPQTRDALASDLDYASGIHADAEPAMLGVKRLVVSGVRRELLALDREADIRADTRAAIEACRTAAAGRQCVSGLVGRAAAWVTLLTPWRWPLAVVCFSPFAGDLFARVFHAIKGGAA